MKTSNKILLGFFIMVFLTPVFVLMSFKSIINKGQFTIVKDQAYTTDNNHSGIFKQYKVIKVIVPEGVSFKCNLESSDSLHYTYSTLNSGINIRVYNSSDTLIVKYTGPLPSVEGYETMTLSLPSIDYLITENAEINLVSPGFSNFNNISAEVYGDGSLNIGAMDDISANASNPAISYKIGKLTVKSKDGEINLGKNVEIGQLNLALDGFTSIAIEEGAIVNEIKGNLSDGSSVKANWKYVKKLLPLTK